MDAKVPLAAYLEAFETTDEEERSARLAAHARQVREHATKLAAKSYWRQFAPTPDFVVMFVPDETLLRVAHEHDRRLARGRVGPGRRARVAEHADDAAAHRRRRAGSRRPWRGVRRPSTSSARSSTSGSATFAGHLAKLGRSLDGAVGRVQRGGRVLRVAGCSSRRGASRSTVSPGSLESPAQIERQARSVASTADEAARRRATARRARRLSRWRALEQPRRLDSFLHLRGYDDPRSTVRS